MNERFSDNQYRKYNMLDKNMNSEDQSKYQLHHLLAFTLLFFFLPEVWLIYHIVSGVQQNDSVTHTCMHILNRPKSSFSFSGRCYMKICMNFLANPMHTDTHAGTRAHTHTHTYTDIIFFRFFSLWVTTRY